MSGDVIKKQGCKRLCYLKEKLSVWKEILSEQPTDEAESSCLGRRSACGPRGADLGHAGNGRVRGHYGLSPPTAPSVNLLSEYFIVHLTEKNNWTVK